MGGWIDIKTVEHLLGRIGVPIQNAGSVVAEAGLPVTVGQPTFGLSSL